MTDNANSDPLFRLLDEFSRSGVKVLHMRSGAFDLLLSNDPTVTGGARAAAPAMVAAPVAAAPAAAVQAPAVTASAAAPVSAAAAITAVSDLPANAVIVSAPNLGTFYRAPKPGAAPYVEIGSTIAVGDELCLIEVMKLFTSVRAEQAGKLHAILAEDGVMVEAGQPLFAVVPA